MVDRLSAAVTGAGGWRRHGIAFAAGALSVLAMAPFFLWPVLFLTLPVLVWLIDGAWRTGASRSQQLTGAALSGWWFGFGYFLLSLFWIGEAFLVEAEVFAWLLPFAVTLLPAGLALFFAAASAAAAAAWSDKAARILVLAAALAASEWIRGHVLTGFPWNVLGYALTAPLALMQSAGVFGIYGLTLIAVVVFAAPLVIVAARPAGERTLRRAATAIAPSAAVIAALYAYGSAILARSPAADVAGVRVRVVQPSIPQREKWQPEKQGEIFRLHLDLSARNGTGEPDAMAGITHVIWPEAAMPFRPLDHPEALEAIAEALPDGVFLISGGLRAEASRDGGRRVMNSLMAFADDGTPKAIYDKIHLVPFGEYLPLQPLLEAIGLEQLTRMRGGFASGPNPRPLLEIGALPKAAGLICYEAIFPRAIVQGDERPGLLLNVTNDGWFGDTTGPRQHLHQARVRAVEEGVPLLRAANNGISAVVDGHGRLVASLAMNARGVIDAGVPVALAPPLYARLGDWVFLVLALIAATLGIVLSAPRPRRPDSDHRH